jgi:hypothetical protein
MAMSQSGQPMRDFRTLRNAIKHGMNLGAYSYYGSDGKVHWTAWRLLGDRPEFKKGDLWYYIYEDELDHQFSRGVFGTFRDLVAGFGGTVYQWPQG